MSLGTARKLGERLRLANAATANKPLPLDLNKTEDIQLDVSTLVKHLGTLIDGRYERNPQCIAAIRTMLLRIKEDRSNERLIVLRYLVRSGIVQNDLVPLLVSNPTDFELWRYGLWLIYELTVTSEIASKRIPPDRMQENVNIRIYLRELDDNRQSCKKIFVDPTFFRHLRDHLLPILQSEDEREKIKANFLGQSIQLLRNITEMRGSVSGNESDSPAVLQDMVFQAMVDSGMSGVILHMVSNDDESEYCIYLLDLLYHLLRHQDPETLGAFTEATARAKSDEHRLATLRAQEAASKEFGRKPIEATVTRHSKFGGAFVLKGSQAAGGQNEMVLLKPAAVILGQNSELTADKKLKGKPRNKRAVGAVEERKEAPPVVSLALKTFCSQFVESAYNDFMSAAKDDIMTVASDIAEDYLKYYFWAVRFFMAFNRARDGNLKFVSETMSIESFHFIHGKIEHHSDVGQTQKDKILLWADREHFALRAYQELTMTLSVMVNHKDDLIKQRARDIEKKLFYVPEYREIFYTLLREFRETKHSRLYLKDLVITIHIFFKLLENFVKSQEKFFVRKKQRQRAASVKKKGARIKKVAKISMEDRTRVFDNQAEELEALLQNPGELQEFTPFDSSSETPVEQQIDIGQYRIQVALLEKDLPRAVSLLKAAKSVWDTGVFGTEKDSTDKDLLLLKSIILLPLADLEVVKEAPVDVSEVLGEDDLTDDLRNERLEAGLMDLEEETVPDEEWVKDFGNYEDQTENKTDERSEEKDEPHPTNEIEFRMEDYLRRFATPSHMEPYFVLLKTHSTNSDLVNHAVVKFFHRIAFDLKLPGMIFQITLFRLYQSIVNDPYHGIPRSFSAERNSTGRYEELHQFMKFILEVFFAKLREDPKTILYTLFWKSRSEAHDLVEGKSDHEPKLKRKGKKSDILDAIGHEINESFGYQAASRNREESPDDDGDVFEKLRGLGDAYDPKSSATAPPKDSTALLKSKKRSRQRSSSGSRASSPSLSPTRREPSPEIEEDILDKFRAEWAKKRAGRDKPKIIRPPSPEYRPSVRNIRRTQSDEENDIPSNALSIQNADADMPKSPDSPIGSPVKNSTLSTYKRRRLIRPIDDEDSYDGLHPDITQSKDAVGSATTALNGDVHFDGMENSSTAVIARTAPVKLKSAYSLNDSDDEDEITATGTKRARLVIDSDDE